MFTEMYKSGDSHNNINVDDKNGKNEPANVCMLLANTEQGGLKLPNWGSCGSTRSLWQKCKWMTEQKIIKYIKSPSF